LVGVDVDAGAKRRLEQLRIGGGDAIPAQRVQVGREQSGLIEASGRQVLPRSVVENLGIDLLVPEHLQVLALRVVVDARQTRDRGILHRLTGDDFLDEVPPLPDADDLAGTRREQNCHGRAILRFRRRLRAIPNRSHLGSHRSRRVSCIIGMRRVKASGTEAIDFSR
jgi:hypothetical protein